MHASLLNATLQDLCTLARAYTAWPFQPLHTRTHVCSLAPRLRPARHPWAQKRQRRSCSGTAALSWAGLSSCASNRQRLSECLQCLGHTSSCAWFCVSALNYVFELVWMCVCAVHTALLHACRWLNSSSACIDASGTYLTLREAIAEHVYRLMDAQNTELLMKVG